MTNSNEQSAPKGLNTINNVVIVGGGTSGWMTAAALARTTSPLTKITLVESQDIGTIGVGEATIPPFLEFNEFLGLDENDLLRACQGTFKLGIEFVDWQTLGQTYFHPFGVYGRDTPDFPFHQLWLRLRSLASSGTFTTGNLADINRFNLCATAARYSRFFPPNGGDNTIMSTMRHAYHIDSTLYGQYLRNYAESKGVVRLEGRVEQCQLDSTTGWLESLKLNSGQVLKGDLFIDCSGFSAHLIEGAMGSAFQDWRSYLPCDRALALATPKLVSPAPYTRATAHKAGWQWCIPLQHRTGNGFVYCSEIMTDDEAHQNFLQSLPETSGAEALHLKFRSGHRQSFWSKNCVAIGLAGGFVEPLESTALHLTQLGIQRLINLWPSAGLNYQEIAVYNRLMTADYQNVRDFIVLHYNVTQRKDSSFWREMSSLPVPDSLKEKIEIFRFSGRIVANSDDIFTPHSWFAVMLGQGIMPLHYDSRTERIPESALIRNLTHLQQSIEKTALAMPYHSEYLKKNCASAT